MYGIRIPRRALRDKVFRSQWMTALEDRALAEQLAVLWIGFDPLFKQVAMAKKQLAGKNRGYTIIEYWSELPGIALFPGKLPLKKSPII